MPDRYWPLEKGHILTSPFGPRDGGYHWGVDLGWPGGSADKPVYVVQGGTVVMVGPAHGFGQWVVVDHPTSHGGGTTVYGHVLPEVTQGQWVNAGERIAHINPDSKTNGGVAPHVHLEWHRYVWARPGPDRLDPVVKLLGASYPGAVQNQKGEEITLDNPITRTQISPNRHSGGRNVTWIAIHTQQGRSNAAGLVSYLCNPASEVSYNAVTDDRETVLVVPWDQNPWSASNANSRADHICLAGSFAEWSRGKWLETNSADGLNEDLMLTRTAALVAWRCQERGIPIEYVGGGSTPPNRPGICGHRDFGQWGGGHTDPGPHFPWDELIYRVKQFAEGLDMQLTDKLVNFEGKNVDLATLFFWLDKRAYQNEVMLMAVLDQLIGPDAGRIIRDRTGEAFKSWPQNGGRTPNDLLAAVAAMENVPGALDTKETKPKDGK